MVVMVDVLDRLGGNRGRVVGRLWRVVGCLGSIVGRLGSFIAVARCSVTCARGSVTCTGRSITSARCSVTSAWCSVAGTGCSVAGAGDSVAVSGKKIRRLGRCVFTVDTVGGVVGALLKQFLHSIDRVGNALECVVHVVVGGLVTTQNTAAVGSEVEVDKRLEGKLAVVIGASLEAEERVEVDCSNLDTLGSRVVRVDGPSSPDGVLLVSSVAGSSLRQAKGDAHRWLELSG